jgi:hypothetical protein
MKYSIPFLMVVLTTILFACKKKKDDTSPAPEVKRPAASFTGMKKWRYAHTYGTSFNYPYTDNTITGTTSCAVSYAKGDTININGNAL